MNDVAETISVFDMYSTGPGCSCGCNVMYPHYMTYRYSPVTYAYPLYTYAPAYCGMPYGYGYNYPSFPAYEMMIPPYAYEMAPQFSRGEYRVGNCMMVCQ